MNVVNIRKSTARPYHHGALAEAMVEQALADVRVRGAEHLSLRGVAQAVGVSPSAAYNHFADKDALLRAVGACGTAALDERMARVLAAHPGNDPQSAIDRLQGLGRAYMAFATEEPHLFRLMFGPTCAELHQQAETAGPYVKLITALDELDDLGQLKPGVRPGLDLTIWAATHGMASLIVDGALSPEAGRELIDSIERLILNEE